MYNMAHTQGWCAGHQGVEAAFVVTMEQVTLGRTFLGGPVSSPYSR